MEVSQLQSPSRSDRSNDEEYPPFLDFGKIKPLRHRWTDPQREVLCVLGRFYSIARKDETEIFSYIFDTEIEGFKNGLPVTTVNTQHYDMLFRRHLIWVSVNSASLADDEEYKECRRVIEIAARELDVNLKSNPIPDANMDATHGAPEPAIEPEYAGGAELPVAGMKPRYDRSQKRPLYRFFNSQSSGINDPQPIFFFWAC
ncbi:hypothetical protein ACJ73_03499 [Blastomyces percursus]|uniref:Uncharacterized protein n=1 Tax=Blastomyces percursus TaxID=1658174 RepID=A0A1J9QY45_9EURO|nr:hypothetical protein ACJ73_03499 [Blastomyces percursus]